MQTPRRCQAGLPPRSKLDFSGNAVEFLRVLRQMRKPSTSFVFVLLASACRTPPTSGVTNEPRPDSTPPAASSVAPPGTSVRDASAVAPQRVVTFSARTLPLESKNGFVRLGSSEDFPAVNREGTEVAMLVHDNESFINAPHEAVIFFDTATGKRLLTATIYSRMEDSPTETPAQLVELKKKGAASVELISRRLAATTWRTLEHSVDDDEYGKPVVDGGFQLSARFGTDLDIGVAESPARASVVPLTIYVTRRGDGGSARAKVPASISQYGSMGMTAGRAAKGGCGWLSSLNGWADSERRFVVIHLQAGAAGDSCALNGESDRTILVPLPK